MKINRIRVFMVVPTVLCAQFALAQAVVPATPAVPADKAAPAPAAADEKAPAPANMADKDWQDLRAALDGLEPPKPYKQMSRRDEDMFVEQYTMVLREKGILFLSEHPTDPRRWSVVSMMDPGAPSFVLRWGEMGKDGKYDDVVDEAAAAAWKTKVQALKKELETAQDLPEDVIGLRKTLAERKAKTNAFIAGWRNREAPDFTTYDLSGKPVKLSGYRGKVVVLDFWASWCTPCKASMPHTQEVAKTYRKQGVVVLAAGTDDKREDFEKFVKANREKYPNLVWTHDKAERGDERASKKLYEVPGIPTQFIIDRKGRVVDVVYGYIEGQLSTEAALAKAGIKIPADVLAKLEKRGAQSAAQAPISATPVIPAAEKAKSTPASMADKDWQDLQAALDAQEPAKPFNQLSPREKDMFFEEQALLSREKAMFFLSEYPADPRRWSLIGLLDSGWPRFVLKWGETEKDGEYDDVVDEAAAAAWKTKVAGLMKALETAQDLPEDVIAMRKMMAERAAKTQAFIDSWVGKKAPDFTTYDLSGKRVKLSDYRGKIVVLDFWASWCVPCKASMPHVQEVAKACRDQGVVVLAAGTNDKREDFEKFVRANQEKYPNLVWTHDKAERSDERASKKLYKVPGIPAQFIIDREGRVVDVVIGYREGQVLTEAALAKAGIKVPADILAKAWPAQSVPAQATVPATPVVPKTASTAADEKAMPAPANMADKDWQDFRTAVDAEPSKPYEQMSPRELQMAFEQEGIVLREKGILFMSEHPTDPRRWSVVNSLHPSIPRFVLKWGEIEKDGKYDDVVDEAAAAAWQTKVQALKKELETAQDLPEDIVKLRKNRAEQKQKMKDFVANWRNANKEAPDFTTFDLAGKPVKLSGYRGKVVVLDFWATWCGPCKASMPHAQEVARTYRKQGVVVLAAGTSDKREDFEKFVKENKQKYPNLVWTHDKAESSDERASKKLYDVLGIPTQFIIDRKGRVVDVVVGYREGQVLTEAALAKVGIKVPADILAKGSADLEKQGS